MITGGAAGHAHLVVEDLGLARLGLGDERVIEHVEHVLADLLELRLDLLSVVADGADVLLGALGLLLLLDRGDDAPGRASRADDVLVRHRQQVALVHGQFTADLRRVSWAVRRVSDAVPGHTLATSCETVSM